MPPAGRFGRVPAAFAAAGVAIALITILSFSGVEWVRASAEWRDHARVVLDRSDGVYAAIREAEASQRGYFLTADPRPLERYGHARNQIIAAVRDLRALTADNPAQQARLDSIEALARNKLQQLDSLIATYRAGDSAALARDIVRVGALNARVRSEMEGFAAAERSLLAQRERGLQRSLTILAASIAASGLLAGGFVAYAAWQMRRNRKQVVEASRRVQELNDALGVRALSLESANQELEAFSYSVSHDLRAPLRHVQGYIELLERSAMERLDEKSRRYLRTISEAAGEMAQLIDDLLAFSRTGRMSMHESGVDLDAVVAAAIRGLEIATQGRRIEWKLAPLPRVQGDPAMLRQVMANLLGNAVKYTRPREVAVIEVGSRIDALGEVEVFVRDNGVGFDMAHAGKLFGVFQRLHHADEFEGTGIGLATVQRILARHGGRIRAEAAPGKGATFRFTLKPASESARTW